MQRRKERGKQNGEGRHCFIPNQPGKPRHREHTDHGHGAGRKKHGRTLAWRISSQGPPMTNNCLGKSMERCSESEFTASLVFQGPVLHASLMYARVLPCPTPNVALLLSTFEPVTDYSCNDLLSYQRSCYSSSCKKSMNASYNVLYVVYSSKDE